MYHGKFGVKGGDGFHCLESDLRALGSKHDAPQHVHSYQHQFEHRHHKRECALTDELHLIGEVLILVILKLLNTAWRSRMKRMRETDEDYRVGNSVFSDVDRAEVVLDEVQRFQAQIVVQGRHEVV